MVYMSLYTSCLISCAHRFWDLSSGSCVLETHLEGLADSQLLACCYATATQLLAVGTYNGSLIVLKLNCCMLL